MDRYGYSSAGSSSGIPYPPVRAPGPRGFGTWRPVVSAVMLVLGCLIAPAALAGVWLHATILDVDGYVAAIAPVADEPAVQEAVADVVADQVFTALDANQTLGSLLPEELDIIGSVTAKGLKSLTRRLTLEAVSSSAFHGFWAAANREVHPRILQAVESGEELELTAGGLVNLDLVDVTRNVTDLLSSSGIALPEILPEALTTGDVALLDSRPLARAGAVIRALDLLYWLLPVAAFASLLSSVLVASRRSRAVIGVGLGLGLAMAALEAGVAWAGVYYLDVTDTAGISHDASAAVWTVVTGSLRLWGWVLLGIGVVAAVAGAVASLVSRPGRAGPAPPQMSVGSLGYPGTAAPFGAPGHSGPT